MACSYFRYMMLECIRYAGMHTVPLGFRTRTGRIVQGPEGRPNIAGVSPPPQSRPRGDHASKGLPLGHLLSAHGSAALSAATDLGSVRLVSSIFVHDLNERHLQHDLAGFVHHQNEQVNQSTAASGCVVMRLRAVARAVAQA